MIPEITRLSENPSRGPICVQESGLRFYNPDTGRWLNRDPVGELGGQNLIEFVYNNPNEYVDPGGENAIAIPRVFCTPRPTTAPWPNVLPYPIDPVVGPVPVPLNPQPNRGNDPSRNPPKRQRGRHWCFVKCHVKQFDPTAKCPKFAYGYGSGASKKVACALAETQARNSTPRGCHTRHCRPTSSGTGRPPIA